MESIVNSLVAVLKTYPFGSGIAALFIGAILLLGLVYLYLNRNQVMTITYGLTLLSMAVFLVLCVFSLFL